MRNNLWLLSAFTVAATLSLAIPDSAEAANRKTSKPHVTSAVAKASKEKSEDAIAEAKAKIAYAENTKHCRMVKEPDKKWDWKNSRLTVEFVKLNDGHYARTVMPGSLNIDEKLPLASITKLMTALVVFDAIDAGKLKPDQMITVHPDSFCLNDNRFALIGLPAGIKEISVRNALIHTLKLSSNTMAINLAIATSGSVEEFVELMNQKAKEWGMDNTQFKNPNGLPEGDRKSEYTTANDMITMAEHILAQFARFKDYSHDALKPWTLKEKELPAKTQLAGLGAVFKTGYINSCASLLTMDEVGDNRIVDVQLCGGKATRFQNAMAALKSGLKRFGDMVVSPAMASDVPEKATPVAVSSLPARSSEP